MRPKTGKKCGNCSHWAELGPGNGVCAFNPPVPLMWQEVSAPPLLRAGARPEVKMNLRAFYPPMGPDGLHCGKWENDGSLKDKPKLTALGDSGA